MLIKTRGIVFRSIKYGETSLIVDIYTEELGLRTYMVSGVRKPKSRMSASFFQIASLLDLVVYERGHKGMQRIKEAKAANLYTDIPFSVVKSAIIQFMLEVTRKTIHEKEKNEDLFQFIFSSFCALDQSDQIDSNFHLKYLLELPRFIGFSLQPTQMEVPYYLDIREGRFTTALTNPTYQINADHSGWINKLLLGETVHLTSAIRKRLINNLLLYYKYHVDGFGLVQAHEVLSEILH